MMRITKCPKCSKYIFVDAHYFCNPEDKLDQHDEHLRTWDLAMIPMFLWQDGAFVETRYWFGWKIKHNVQPRTLCYPWTGYWDKPDPRDQHRLSII